MLLWKATPSPIFLKIVFLILSGVKLVRLYKPSDHIDNLATTKVSLRGFFVRHLINEVAEKETKYKASLCKGLSLIKNGGQPRRSSESARPPQ